MPLTVYNTMSRREEAFVPLDPERVTMYVCGPTVYSYPHIGNARPAVVFDVLYRLLRRLYPKVVYARNITDIDDKINAAAAEQGVGIDVISARFTAVYHEDMRALGVTAPDVEPRATEHMTEMIALMEALIEAGHAYAAEGHVLFDVATFDDYGRLSKRNMDDMIAGARVEVAPYKRNPADFVLWKPSSDEQPGWDSPWGRGRPGWHTECCTMVEKHLGETIDIHGGGHDLIFPHHENEIAQSVCFHHGRPLARYWMHNGFVNIDAEKMSKSLGNVLLVRKLLEQAPGEAVRFALLSAHYRKPLDWSADTPAGAKRNLNRLYGALRELGAVEAADSGPPAELVAALEDDLNTPQAIAVLFALAGEAFRAKDSAARARIKGELLAGGALLGILQDSVENWFTGDVDDAGIDALIAERIQARAERNFARADEIRDQLTAMGIAIEDTAGGTRWKKN